MKKINWKLVSALGVLGLVIVFFVTDRTVSERPTEIVNQSDRKIANISQDSEVTSDQESSTEEIPLDQTELIPLQKGLILPPMKREEALSVQSQDMSVNDTSCELKPQRFERTSSLSLTPSIGYQKISGSDRSNGANATLYSDEIYVVDLAWKQHWSEKFSSIIGFSHQSFNYQEVSNRSLEKDSISATNILIGFEYLMSEKISISSAMGYGGQLYLYGPSSSSLRIDKANTFSNRTDLKIRLADLRPFELSTMIGARVVAPTKVDTYRSEFGYAVHAGVELAQELKSGNRIKAQFQIEHGKFDTTAVKQNHDQMSLGIGMEWRFK